MIVIVDCGNYEPCPTTIDKMDDTFTSFQHRHFCIINGCDKSKYKDAFSSHLNNNHN